MSTTDNSAEQPTEHIFKHGLLGSMVLWEH